MAEIALLNVHLSTNEVTGALVINLDPAGDHTTPVDVSEWPSLRSAIRERIRERIADDRKWTPYLDSDRTGERLDVRIGTVRVERGTGDIRDIDLHATSPSDVDW